jgi:TonB family protein
MRFIIRLSAILLCATAVSAQLAGPKDPPPRTQSFRAEEARTEQPTPGDAIYRVQNLADRILELHEVKARVIGVAKLANLVWTQDESYARLLFEKSLNLASGPTRDNESKLSSSLRLSVIAIIARRDSEWATRLIEVATPKDASRQDSKTRSAMNMNTALDLLDGDPEVAVQFAERSLQGGINPALLDFLLDLRKTKEAAANQLFLQALAQLDQNRLVDIRQVHRLGIYLFTAQELLESDSYGITRVGDILVPNLAVPRPGASPPLVQAYLSSSVNILWRTVSDPEQRQFSYALAYLLLPKYRTFAPALAPPVEAVLSALTPKIPANLAQESAFKYIDPPLMSVADKLSDAENRQDQESRDVAFLDLAFSACTKGDFKTARLAAGGISNRETSEPLAVMIDFGEAAWILKRTPKRFAQARTIADKLPQGIERTILLLAIAQTSAKTGNPVESEQAVNAALKGVRSVADQRRPFLLLAAASQLASLRSPTFQWVLADAVKDLNSFDSSPASVDWSQSVQAGPLTTRFPIDTTGVPLDFESTFRPMAAADVEACLLRAEELKNEDLRAQAFVEVATALLNEAQKGQAIRVGEDGMRKSVAKTIMPVYPEEALRKRQQGVTVIELEYDGKGDVSNVTVVQAPAVTIGEAASKAVAQWKFVPSKTQDGKPVSIRGKLTFYFEIDKDGKGRVENPKQFR